jgi:hypothetical protein
MRRWFLGLAMMAACAATPAGAQGGRPDPAPLIAAQQEAMKRLAWMAGRWQGPAWEAFGGRRLDMIQTERVGPMLDGAVLVVEGKAFLPDGKPAGFNAMGVISYDAFKKAYTFQSWAQGSQGTFPLTVAADGGWSWTVPAGPMAMRYTTTRDGDGWREVGEMVRPDGTATRIFEMTLKRLGDTDWPLGGQATAPKR